MPHAVNISPASRTIAGAPAVGGVRNRRACAFPRILSSQEHFNIKHYSWYWSRKGALRTQPILSAKGSSRFFLVAIWIPRAFSTQWLSPHCSKAPLTCALATRLKESLWDDDTVDRIGGEEFFIVSTMQAGTDALALCASIRSRIAQAALVARSVGLHITALPRRLPATP